MHVWLGGHGTAPGTDHAAAGEVTVAAHGNGTGPDQHLSQPLPALTAAAGGAMADGMPVGCGADCADEMVLGLCMLALVIAVAAGLPAPAHRWLSSALSRRGPPAASRRTRAVRPPSLTQLCISRT